jgi:hypothetical protein
MIIKFWCSLCIIVVLELLEMKEFELKLVLKVVGTFMSFRLFNLSWTHMMAL